MYTDKITINGTTYKMIDEAEVTNLGAPAEAVCVWYGVRADDQPDKFGCLSLYQFRYSIPEPDEETCSEWWDLVDWENPDDIVEAQYRWLEAEQRMV